MYTVKTPPITKMQFWKSGWWKKFSFPHTLTLILASKSPWKYIPFLCQCANSKSVVLSFKPYWMLSTEEPSVLLGVDEGKTVAGGQHSSCHHCPWATAPRAAAEKLPRGSLSGSWGYLSQEVSIMTHCLSSPCADSPLMLQSGAAASWFMAAVPSGAKTHQGPEQQWHDRMFQVCACFSVDPCKDR